MKETRENRGYKVEERLRKFFKGTASQLDEVDFETSTSLYEVKSCKLFNKCYNANHLRKYKNKPHKRIETHQLGRFKILTDNHIMLYLRSLQTGKIPKYIFAMRYGNQIIFRIIKWKELIVTNNKDYHYITLGEIFYEKLDMVVEPHEIAKDA